MAAVSPKISLGMRPPMRAMRKNSEQHSQAMHTIRSVVVNGPIKRQAMVRRA